MLPKKARIQQCDKNKGMTPQLSVKFLDRTSYYHIKTIYKVALLFILGTLGQEKLFGMCKKPYSVFYLVCNNCCIPSTMRTKHKFSYVVSPYIFHNHWANSLPLVC